jgi:hypothetical protein
MDPAVRRIFLVIMGLATLVYLAVHARVWHRQHERLDFAMFVDKVRTTPEAFERGSVEMTNLLKGRTQFAGQWSAGGRGFVTSGEVDDGLLELLSAHGLMANQGALSRWPETLIGLAGLVVASGLAYRLSVWLKARRAAPPNGR